MLHQTCYAVFMCEFLPPANEVCEGCFYTCLSVHKGEGWYPSMHCRSPDPHPGGKLRCLAWGGGVSRPTPGGFSRPTPRGVSRPTPEVGGLSQHALRQTPKQTATTAGTSYWNTFLFTKYTQLGARGGRQRILCPNFAENCIKVKTIVREARPIF